MLAPSSRPTVVPSAPASGDGPSMRHRPRRRSGSTVFARLVAERAPGSCPAASSGYDALARPDYRQPRPPTDRHANVAPGPTRRSRPRPGRGNIPPPDPRALPDRPFICSGSPAATRSPTAIGPFQLTSRRSIATAHGSDRPTEQGRSGDASALRPGVALIPPDVPGVLGSLEAWRGQAGASRGASSTPLAELSWLEVSGSTIAARARPVDRYVDARRVRPPRIPLRPRAGRRTPALRPPVPARAEPLRQPGLDPARSGWQRRTRSRVGSSQTGNHLRVPGHA